MRSDLICEADAVDDSAPGDAPAQVLVVDDHADIREPLVTYLARCGLRAVGAADGKAMRTQLALQHFDLIVLDIMMPGEDGLSLCRHVAATSGTPVILLTARTGLAERVRGLEVGADDEFVDNLLDLDAAAVVSAAQRQRAQLKHPPIEVDRYLEILLRQGLVQTTKVLATYRTIL